MTWDAYQYIRGVSDHHVDTSTARLKHLWTTTTMLQDALAILKAWQGPLTLLAVFFGPSLLKRILSLRSPTLKSPPSSPLAKLILLAQLVYTVYNLVYPSYDVFSTPGIKITTPTNTLRPLVAQAVGLTASGNSTGDALYDLLLVRLGNIDARIQYVRWGHGVFLPCAWCRSSSDYALAAIPSVLRPYLFEAILIGMLGWMWVMGPGFQLRLDKYRPVVGWAIVFLGGAEYVARAYWEIWVSNGDCLHLDTVIVRARGVVLWLLTAGYVLLPVRPTQTQEVQHELIRTLDASYTVANLTSSARSAVTRSPRLSALAAEYERKNNEAITKGRRENGIHPEAKNNAARFVRDKWESVVRFE